MEGENGKDKDKLLLEISSIYKISFTVLIKNYLPPLKIIKQKFAFSLQTVMMTLQILKINQLKRSCCLFCGDVGLLSGRAFLLDALLCSSL